MGNQESKKQHTGGSGANATCHTTGPDPFSEDICRQENNSNTTSNHRNNTGSANSGRGSNNTNNNNNNSPNAVNSAATTTTAATSAPTGPEVKLHVYNLLKAHKRGRSHFNTSLGFGIFHTGVEVLGREWTFGGNPAARPGDTGVFCIPPGHALPPQQVFDVISLGRLPMGATTEIIELAVCQRLLPEWTALSYHVLGHNCNHFSEAFVQLLNSTFNVELKVPPFINRAARFADVLVPEKVLNKIMGAAPQAPPDTQNTQRQQQQQQQQKNGTAATAGGRRAAAQTSGAAPSSASHRHFENSGTPTTASSSSHNRRQSRSNQQGGDEDFRVGDCGMPSTTDEAFDEATLLRFMIPATDAELRALAVKDLKVIMWANGIPWDGLVEKEELVAAISARRNT